MKNRPVIIAAVCFGIVVALHVGTIVAVRNFIDIPFVPIALAVIALLVMGFVFSFKALKRERSPRTYAVAAVGVLILAGLILLSPDWYALTRKDGTKRKGVIPFTAAVCLMI